MENKISVSEDGHSFIYWIFFHLWNEISKFAKNHRSKFVVVSAITLLVLYILRAMVHPLVLTLRIYSFDFALVAFALYGVWRVHKRTMSKWAYVAAMVLSALIVLPHDYIALYLRQVYLDKEAISDYMETVHDRIQPLNSIRSSINKQHMSKNEQANEPYFIRGATGDYRWTTGIEPLNGIQSFVGGVNEVVSVSATDPSPDYSKDSSIAVSFPVGEFLHFGKNSKVCAIRSFGILRFFSYEPADVKYVEEGKGKFVQVISLTKWDGFVWPQPVFGGVQIIRQSDGGFFHFIETVLWGDGEWIAPENIGKYPFLKGQNLVPFKVSRYIAKSFSFYQGMLNNIPGVNTNGAVRIPDLPGDANDQPFVTCFRQENGEEKSFHYFGMVPSQADGQSLSLFVPGDGLGPVKVYDNNLNHDSMIGVSAINAKTGDRHIDWTHTRPAEHRPYIKTILGKKRFMWLTTLVTTNKNIADILSKNAAESEGEDFQAGGLPTVVLTEPHRSSPILMKSLDADTWPAQAEKEFQQYWK